GESTSGRGVSGRSKGASGVAGESTDNNGVFGVSHSSGQAAILGINDNHDGVQGFSKHSAHAGVVGTNTGNGTGVLAQSTSGVGLVATGGTRAARFDGIVEVTVDIQLTKKQGDCAEEFDIADASSVYPGTVMVLGEDGTLHQSNQAYDKRVAGVISGAGDYRPGIVLDRQESQPNRKPIALVGKVYCKVDASYAPIEVGDLLTTSATPGHAMKAGDPFKAFGSVIGKALRPLANGQGLIPILIVLQ